jgi:hypothetical protein
MHGMLADLSENKPEVMEEFRAITGCFILSRLPGGGGGGGGLLRVCSL